MKRYLSVIYPVITLATVFGLWCLASYVWQVPTYVLPKPDGVIAALKIGYVDGRFYPHLAYTVTAMSLGYVVGCGLALIVGAIVAEWEPVERLVYPLVISLQSMPKVALAPLIIVWFGFDLMSKVVMVALICFFPLFINTVVGLRQANPALIDMMNAFSASRWLVFRRIKLPSAAGHIFAGLQIAIVLSLIGAVVAEFISSTKGLGHLIAASAVNLDVNVMFAALISLSLVGTVATQSIRYLHAKVVFWEKSPLSTLSE